jgi:hypothetical protein
MRCPASLLTQPSQALVPAPAPALAARSSALAYAGGAIGSPVAVATLVFAACVGLGFAGALGAVAAMSAVIGLAVMSSRSGAIRRHLDAQAALRARYRREALRLKQLRPTGAVRQQQYVELRDLVEQIERTAPLDAERFELQDLLDHFVRLSLSHQRCLEALRLSGTQDLPSTISLTSVSAARSKRRHEIVARRLKHREECLRRVERLADEIDATDELIRLIAQRAACPSLDPEVDREIDRRLWELDEIDAAIRQLSASA